ncbi:ProQ/FINO family protein [Ensifer sp. HO-A22]|uniref:ProQ/FINO family protein n=1 Tax=Ensifer oleiphilus TaxID=2742698 RepID=A0A7Y6QBX4_9HYPH|nr:ProQ/FINO family protein [Ensifer oleiphilus]NVD42804.1 ProQ/FINO family protein [Ensifer oleiphilus]
MSKSSREKSGPVVARETDVLKAQAINALLTQPIAILPTETGHAIRPFALGLWNEIRPLLRPEISVSALRRATGAYLHSKRYHMAVAQPRSARHDTNGMPVDTVSDADRLAASEKIESIRKRDETRKAAAPAVVRSIPASKADMIRAALFNRNNAPR